MAAEAAEAEAEGQRRREVEQRVPVNFFHLISRGCLSSLGGCGWLFPSPVVGKGAPKQRLICCCGSLDGAPGRRRLRRRLCGEPAAAAIAWWPKQPLPTRRPPAAPSSAQPEGERRPLSPLHRGCPCPPPCPADSCWVRPAGSTGPVPPEAQKWRARLLVWQGKRPAAAARRLQCVSRRGSSEVGAAAGG